jgi:hypothetical protein
MKPSTFAITLFSLLTTALAFDLDVLDPRDRRRRRDECQPCSIEDEPIYNHLLNMWDVCTLMEETPDTFCLVPFYCAPIYLSLCKLHITLLGCLANFAIRLFQGREVAMHI